MIHRCRQRESFIPESIWERPTSVCRSKFSLLSIYPFPDLHPSPHSLSYSQSLSFPSSLSRRSAAAASVQDSKPPQSARYFFPYFLSVPHSSAAAMADSKSDTKDGSSSSGAGGSSLRAEQWKMRGSPLSFPYLSFFLPPCCAPMLSLDLVG